MTMTHEWKNKIVFITGAASGIGAAVVRKVVEQGVKHVRIYDINEKAGIEFQNEINSKYGSNKVRFVKGDVTDEEHFVGAIKAVFDEQRGLDVLINNAGIMNDSLRTYKKSLEVNVIAVVTGTLKAIELMSKENDGNGGTVINISSIAALFQGPLLPIYYGAKSAVLQFSNCIGVNEYYSRTGVRVLAICFGATETPLQDRQNVGSFDKVIDAMLIEETRKFVKFQTVDSAAQGLVDMYKQAESGNTWISTTDRPVKEITDVIKQAYEILSKPVFE